MGSDKIVILKSNVEKNAFLLIGLEYFFKNLLATTICYEKAQMVLRAMVQDTKVKGLPDSIDPSKPQRNYQHVMSIPTPRNGQRRTTRSTWALNNAVSSTLTDFETF
jgi:hypothetical protein